jgi:[ribosomal protein S5]-alanine N-acetyltransferase
VIGILRNSLISPPTIQLEGKKVAIRPPQARDWQEWALLRERSRAFLTPWEPTWPADALARSAYQRRLKRQILEWRDDEAYSFLAFTRDTGGVVGGIGLSNIRRGVAQTGTLGYWVGEPYARRGYMSEATRLSLDFAFGQLGLHRVEAACLPTNAPSRGLLEKVGFQYEGYARGYLRIDGAWRDHVLYAILREEWRP